jgi:hypothetical protein
MHVNHGDFLNMPSKLAKIPANCVRACPAQATPDKLMTLCSAVSSPLSLDSTASGATGQHDKVSCSATGATRQHNQQPPRDHKCSCVCTGHGRTSDQAMRAPLSASCACPVSHSSATLFPRPCNMRLCRQPLADEMGFHMSTTVALSTPAASLTFLNTPSLAGPGHCHHVHPHTHAELCTPTHVFYASSILNHQAGPDCSWPDVSRSSPSAERHQTPTPCYRPRDALASTEDTHSFQSCTAAEPAVAPAVAHTTGQPAANDGNAGRRAPSVCH